MNPCPPEDYDLWLRLCHRFPVHFIEQALIIKYGGHEDQLSRRYPAMDRYRVRALHRLLETELLSAEYFEAARATLRAKLDILRKGARKHGNHSLIDEIEPLHRRWCDDSRQAAC